MLWPHAYQPHRDRYVACRERVRHDLQVGRPERRNALLRHASARCASRRLAVRADFHTECVERKQSLADAAIRLLVSSLSTASSICGSRKTTRHFRTPETRLLRGCASNRICSPVTRSGLYLDGKRVDGLPGAGDSFSLNDVFRGTHTLVAVVTDQTGKRLISSQTVTFHMHQTSILTKKVPTPH